MLKTMRKHAKFFYVLFFIVILTFIFWGVGTLDKPTAVSVAEINGEKISVEEYWRAYDNMRQVYKDLYKEQFNEEMEKRLKLKEAVLSGLIEERLLLISVKEMGINVTDRELQDAIMSDQRFMRDGIFRKDVYFRTLQLNRLTPEMFETSMRQQLALLKMKRLIGSAIDANPLDLRGISGDDKKAIEAQQAILLNKRDAALKSYVESVRKSINIKVNTDLIS
ncbi:MAG: SurA N-terminal domain-containing protein [Thermodesulfovibrionales bacterium]|nr:SurA N-terminal domain-containing protein [Thermodesulfovibrionales bacterium]